MAVIIFRVIIDVGGEYTAIDVEVREEDIEMGEGELGDELGYAEKLELERQFSAAL